MRSTFLLFAVLALTVYGQIVIKARALMHAADAVNNPDRLHYLFAMLTDIWLLSSLCAAVVAAICWILAIERLDVGYAYPFMALSFVLVPAVAVLLFNEPLTIPRLFGLSLIIAGVTINALAR